MKLMPSSIAVRTMRRLSFSSTCLRPRCQPPSPIDDTFSPVRPRTRRGTPDGCETLVFDIGAGSGMIRDCALQLMR